MTKAYHLWLPSERKVEVFRGIFFLDKDKEDAEANQRRSQQRRNHSTSDEYRKFDLLTKDFRSNLVTGRFRVK